MAGSHEAVDTRPPAMNDERMVEYGSLTSALAVLASALAGLVSLPAASLPATDGKASALVTVTAGKQHVDAAKARSVYRRAPYGKPFLRYLYTVGWMSGSRNMAWCAFGKASGTDPARDAARQIRSDRKLVARLGAMRVTVAVAAAAVGKGVASACDG